MRNLSVWTYAKYAVTFASSHLACYTPVATVTEVYLTSPGPLNFGQNSPLVTPVKMRFEKVRYILFCVQFQNSNYHWIPRVYPILVIVLAKPAALPVKS